MHPSTFEYLMPTEDQKERMTSVRNAFADCMVNVVAHVPEGPDRTYLMRQLRECAMWANVAITRNPDGSPRREE